MWLGPSEIRRPPWGWSHLYPHCHPWVPVLQTGLGARPGAGGDVSEDIPQTLGICEKKEK